MTSLIKDFSIKEDMRKTETKKKRYEKSLDIAISKQLYCLDIDWPMFLYYFVWQIVTFDRSS